MSETDQGRHSDGSLANGPGPLQREVGRGPREGGPGHEDFATQPPAAGLGGSLAHSLLRRPIVRRCVGLPEIVYKTFDLIFHSLFNNHLPLNADSINARIQRMALRMNSMA